MPKINERKKTIKVEPYNYTLHIVVSDDIVESYKKRELSAIDKVTEREQPDQHTEAFIWRHEGCVEIYAFFKPNATPSTVAHEMLHVCGFIMRRVGVPLTDDTEEAWAYLLDNLVEKSCTLLNKPVKKKSLTSGTDLG